MEMYAFYLISRIIVEDLISNPTDGTFKAAMRSLVAFISIAGLVFITKNGLCLTRLLAAIFICENFIVTLGIGTEILNAFAHNTPYEDYPLYPGILLILWYPAIVAYRMKRMFSFHTGNCIALACLYFSLAYGGPFGYECDLKKNHNYKKASSNRYKPLTAH